MLKRSTVLLFVLFVLAFPAFAQGGWDVWTVYLRDGSTQSAAPLWSLDTKSLKSGFMAGGKASDVGIERSRINYLSNNLGNSEYARSKQGNFVAPPLPEKSSNKDIVVFADGRQELGSVIIRARQTGSQYDTYNPVLVLNGKEYPLTSVAHIRLAAPKTAPPKVKPKARSNGK